MRVVDTLFWMSMGGFASFKLVNYACMKYFF